jgi:hypothetical protein
MDVNGEDANVVCRIENIYEVFPSNSMHKTLIPFINGS